jgi:CubicO group peptidase (beta-lactamase class C family)
MTANNALPATYRNPDLVVNQDNLAGWNMPHRRRHGFHNLHLLQRYGLLIRSPDVMMLNTDIDRRIGDLPEARRLTSTNEFSAIAVVQGDRLLFERYAPDFGPDRPHSMQSMTKTTLNLVFGRLVEDGVIDLGATIADYIPEIGSGYAAATIQQVLDMNVVNVFNEDYDDPYSPAPAPGEPVGYGRQEVGLSWRLPPAGEDEYSMRDFITTIASDDISNPSGETNYKSPNTDLLGWVAERASGRSLRDFMADIVKAAGLEGGFHVALSSDFSPVVSGGGFMTARDLARYAMLFARKGVGVHGETVGSAAFIEETRSGRGTAMPEPREWLRYSNQTNTNGQWLGHGGYGGQYFIADPDKDMAAVFFSVLQDKDAGDKSYTSEVIRLLEEIVALY